LFLRRPLLISREWVEGSARIRLVQFVSRVTHFKCGDTLFMARCPVGADFRRRNTLEPHARGVRPLAGRRRRKAS